MTDFVSFGMQTSAEKRGSYKSFLKFLLGGHNHNNEKAVLKRIWKNSPIIIKCSIRNNWHTINIFKKIVPKCQVSISKRWAFSFLNGVKAENLKQLTGHEFCSQKKTFAVKQLKWTSNKTSTLWYREARHHRCRRWKRAT